MPQFSSTIDIRKCTRRVRAAFIDTIEMATRKRFEYLTPEVLLFNVVNQTEFREFCSGQCYNHSDFVKELGEFIESQDRLPEGDAEKGMLSNNFSRLFVILAMVRPDAILRKKGIVDEGYEERYRNAVVDMSALIQGFYALGPDCMATYFLSHYISEDPSEWLPILMSHYYNDDAVEEEKPFKLPPFVSAEAIVNGKTVDISTLGNDEVFRKMMEQANEIIRHIGQSSQYGNFEENDDDDDDDDRPQREPWENLVTCLNEVYKHKNPLVGRERELSRCIRILCRKDKNNPLFIGEPGVGKTALIYGLVRMIEEGNVPQWLQGYKVYALEMASMVAGASYHGEFEKRMKSVLEGVRKRGNSIVYIDEIHSICETGGGSNSINAADMLKPYLEDGSIRFIGCSTYQDYNRAMAGKKAIARRFGLIDVKEPTVEETLAILEGLLPHYEGHHGVRYDREAVRYAVEQSATLIHDRFLPDKAIDIVDEAGAYLQQHPLLNRQGLPKAARYQKVGKEIIRSILTDVCRIDAKALTSQSNDELQGLAARITGEIYGQDAAVDRVVRAVMMAKAGLTEPGKPMASLLFVGPTGVGKTEVCKVLAQELGIALVRFDMSEYTEKHTVSKLIGSPAGYVGHDEGGLLTDAIRKTPSCVLLLDEIEKAHTDIYNILLQVMDYACLTDNKGNKADFRNVILVMTSNAGAQFASRAAVGFAGGLSKGEAMLDTVKKTFKPEFLNRLSGTVVFNDMDLKMASLILDKKLRQLSARLEKRGAAMQLSDEARDFLLRKGFNPQYGAREMDRVIARYLSPILTEALLFGKLRKGGEARIILQGDGLAIE